MSSVTPGPLNDQPACYSSKIILLVSSGLLLIPQFLSLPTGISHRDRISGLPRVYSGDEPQYLVMLNSLLSDGDLELTNNYQQVHAGDRDAGLWLSGATLDHHTSWYVDGVFVRWDKVYRAWELPWDRDADGVPIPTLIRPEDEHLEPIREYSYHPPGLPLLLSLLTFSLAETDLLEPAAIFFCWVVAIIGLLTFGRLMTQYTTDDMNAALVASIVFLGTPLWHYSRALFTEIWLATFVAIAFASILKGHRTWTPGLLVACGVMMKPPFALLSVPLVFYLAFESTDEDGRPILLRQRAWNLTKLILPILVAIGATLLLNQHMHGSPWRGPQTWRWGDFFSGVTGLLFSTEHGLLPFAPVAVLALLAWPRFLIQHRRDGLVIGSGVLLYFCLVACWEEWQGGYCYGPRLIVPILPVLLVPLSQIPWTRISVLSASCWVVAANSIVVNAMGAIPYWQYWGKHPFLG